MKKNIIALSFFALLIMSGCFYLLAMGASKYKEEDLINLVIEKTRSALYSNTDRINKSIESSDDIALLANIENLAKLENIKSCFILDKNNTVIIHNNTNEWNTKRSSDEYTKALSSNGELIQKTPDNEHLLLSVPLSKNNTLFAIISLQKAFETAKYWKIKYFTIGAVAVILLTILFYFLAKLFILLPFNRTKRLLEKSSLEKIKSEKYDEITDIFVTENEKSLKMIESLENDKESLSKIIEYYVDLTSDQYSAFIILNSLSNIIYAYDKTGKILKKGFSHGNHILESLAEPSILKIINKSMEKPGKEFTEQNFDFDITAISIGSKNKPSGIIIKAK